MTKQISGTGAATAGEASKSSATPVYRALAAAFLDEGVDTLFVLTGDGNMHWEAAFAEARRHPLHPCPPRALRLRHGDGLCRRDRRGSASRR